MSGQATPVPLLDAARTVLAAQPFSALLGAELTSIGDGRAELRIPLGERHRQQDGAAHGGVIAYAAESVLGFAAGSVAGANVRVASFTISYLALVSGIELVARAEVVKAGSRVVAVQAELFDAGEDGEHRCAVAQGTVVR